MLVLRDESTSECYVVDFDESELDIDRLDEANLEIAGVVKNSEAVRIVPTEAEQNAVDDYEQLYFTTCEKVVDESKPLGDDSGRYCGKWILIIDDGAPEFCTEHEEDE